jgi:hypothetical protein
MVVNCGSDRLKFVRTLKNWKLLRKFPAKDIAFYGITCNHCAPHISEYGHTGRPAGFRPRELELTKLNKSCTYCDIIRRVHCHFVDNPAVKYVESSGQNMHHLHFRTKSNDIELVYLYSLGTCVLA